MAALPEDPGVSSSIHMEAHNHLELYFNRIQCPCPASVGTKLPRKGRVHELPCLDEESLI